MNETNLTHEPLLCKILLMMTNHEAHTDAAKEAFYRAWVRWMFIEREGNFGGHQAQSMFLTEVVDQQVASAKGWKTKFNLVDVALDVIDSFYEDHPALYEKPTWWNEQAEKEGER